MSISKTGYEENGTWESYSETKELTLDGSLDGENRNIYITVEDEAGNKTQITLVYKPYKECSNTTTSTSTGTCSSSCTQTVTTSYKDRYTSKVCNTSSSSQSCSGGNCSSGGSSGGGSSGGSPSIECTPCTCGRVECRNFGEDTPWKVWPESSSRDCGSGCFCDYRTC